MFALILFLLVLALFAALVVLYATYTYRGLPIPGMGWMDRHAHALTAAVTHRIGGPLENTAVAGALVNHGVVLDTHKDTDLRHRFWQAERRIVAKLPRSQRRQYELRHTTGITSAPAALSSPNAIPNGTSPATITGEHKIALI